MLSSQIPSSVTLTGLRIAVIRAADDPLTLADHLRRLGAEVVHYPCLDILPPNSIQELDNALLAATRGEFSWLVLSSAGTVRIAAERLTALSIDLKRVATLKIAVIEADAFLTADHLLEIPDDRVVVISSTPESVGSMQIGGPDRVLLLQPAFAKPILAELLRATGADVAVVNACRQRIGQGGDEVPAMLWAGVVDAVIFTSDTNVRAFVRRLHQEGGTLAMLDDVCVACIERLTAEAARGYGLHVDVVPQAPTLSGLAAAVAAYFSTD